jgi:hypothetical protein
MGQGLHGPSHHRSFPSRLQVDIPSFREIIFIDHKDCGAFKKFYPDITPETEEEIHRKHMQKAYDKLGTVFPNFKFRAYLMDISGSVKELTIEERPKIDPNLVKDDPFLMSLMH